MFIFLLFTFSCTKECVSTNNENCIDFSLIPIENIENSRDLYEYLIRDDSTLATSVKLVQNNGYINWKANAEVTNGNGRHGIVLRNYFDTTDWRNLFNWVNKRDLIELEFYINQKGKQKLFDEETYAKDSNTLRAVYFRTTADGDVFDAGWKLDCTFENSIEITKFDSQFIEDNFNLYFNLERQSNLYIYAPAVQFRCGQFKAKII